MSTAVKVTKSPEEYSGKFNWHGSEHVLKTVAVSPVKAKQNMMYRLAAQLKTPVQIVNSYFKQHPNCFKIS